MVNEYLRVFRAFSDENRLRVLELLFEGEQCACILLEDMNISQPTLSHHMKILCESGIVKKRREGKWNYYSIDEEGCRHANRLLDAVARRKPFVYIVILRFYYHIRSLFKSAGQVERVAIYPEELFLRVSFMTCRRRVR